MEYQTGVTAGGWTVAVAPVEGVESVCVGLWFPVGSRYESADHAGASHFVEHMLFKGSKRRSAKEISQAIEGVGGYLNAFTAEEMTSYYASATASHLGLVLDVLLDMVYGSTFPAGEIERERGVILEEIKMYEDQPAQLAGEGLNQLLWPGNPLGRPITGTRDSVRKMTREDLLSHCRQYYTPQRMQITVAGKTTLSEVKQILDRRDRRQPVARGKLPASTALLKPRRSRRIGLALRQKPIEQTHLALGLLGVSRNDPQRYALKLGSVILGENMSSRLFQKIRERHGLAYSIGSSVSFFNDTGVFSISAGVENDRAQRASRMILDQVQLLAQRAPSPAELRRAKDYVVGQMWMGLESTSNQVMWMGEALLGYGAIYSPKEIEHRLQAVTAGEVSAALARLVSNDRLCCSIVSPESDPRGWKEVVRFV